MISVKLVRWIESGARPSLHALVRSELRRASAGPLPRAVELAGTFPVKSGAQLLRRGHGGRRQPVDDDWVQLDQFQPWLDSATTPARTRARDEGGQVLVWRQDGDLAHAAVTLPGGWSLQKPSQSWSSPIGVWTTDEIISSWRLPGVRLSRYQLL